jgi:hypothetical protein
MDAESALWGFKDPRALLVLDEWERQLAPRGGPVYVGIYRHPLAVHQSLQNRNPRFDTKRSTKLWCDYNEQLVACLERAPFPLLRFDVDPDALLRGLASILRHLDLPGADEPSDFFENRLVHNDASDDSVPWRCRKLWRALEDRRLRI